MKRLIFQIVCMSICLLCSVMLTIGMFVYCIKYQGELDYTPVVFGSLFTFVALMCECILFQCVQEYHECKDLGR